MSVERLPLDHVICAAVVSLLLLFPLGLNAEPTGASTGLLIHKITPPPSSVGDYEDDATYALSELDTTYYGGTISGKAEAYAQYRLLKAYADIDYTTGTLALECSSGATAWYDDTIDITAPENFWLNYTADLKLAFHLDGSLTTSGTFTMDYARLQIQYSPDPENEPRNDFLDLEDCDENGLAYLTIYDYSGDALDLHVMLDTILYAYGANLSGSGVSDFYSTMTYHSTTVLDDDQEVLAQFDANNNLISGDPGWAMTSIPEPATLSLLTLGALTLLRKRRA